MAKSNCFTCKWRSTPEVCPNQTRLREVRDVGCDKYEFATCYDCKFVVLGDSGAMRDCSEEQAAHCCVNAARSGERPRFELKRSEKMTRLNKLGFDWSNDAKRKEWLANYEEWGKYAEVIEFELEFYKYDLPNGSRIVVCTYPSSYTKSGNAALFYWLKTPESVLIPKFPEGENYCADKLKDLNKLLITEGKE